MVASKGGTWARKSVPSVIGKPATAIVSLTAMRLPVELAANAARNGRFNQPGAETVLLGRRLRERALDGSGDGRYSSRSSTR